MHLSEIYYMKNIQGAQISSYINKLSQVWRSLTIPYKTCPQVEYKSIVYFYVFGIGFPTVIVGRYNWSGSIGLKLAVDIVLLHETKFTLTNFQ